MDSYPKEKEATAVSSNETAPLPAAPASKRGHFEFALFRTWCLKHKRIAGLVTMLLFLLPLLGLLSLQRREARAKWTSEVVYPSRMFRLEHQECVEADER